MSLIVGLAVGAMFLWASTFPRIMGESSLSTTGGDTCNCHDDSTSCWDLDTRCNGTIILCDWNETISAYNYCNTSGTQTPCFGPKCPLTEKISEKCEARP